MLYKGFHYAIKLQSMKRLIKSVGKNDILHIVQEELELESNQGWTHETDMAWEAIHQSLTQAQLDLQLASLRACVLGGEKLYEESRQVVSLLRPTLVKEVANSLSKLTLEELKRGYEAIDESDYSGDLSEDDFDYIWDWYKDLPEFFSKAADSGRAVIFTTHP